MKHLSLIISVFSLLAVFLLASCAEDDPIVADNDVTPSSEEVTQPSVIDTTDTSDPDAFIPYTGPIEPLSEDLRPVLTDDKIWYYKFTLYDAYNDSVVIASDIQKRSICGDTILLGRNGKKIARNDIYYTGPEYAPFIWAEEDGKIYKYCESSNLSYDWNLQYDINLNNPLTITTTRNKIIAISRGTMVLMGKTRRVVKIWCGKAYDHDSPIEYWVEGIGPLFGHDNIIYSSVSPSAGGTHFQKNTLQLTQCYEGDEKIYDYREFSHDLYVEEEVFTDISSLM